MTKKKSSDYISYEIVSFLNAEGKIKLTPNKYVDYFFYFFLISHDIDLRTKIFLSSSVIFVLSSISCFILLTNITFGA